MIYEYKCPSCNNRFEVVKRVKEFDKPELCKCGFEAKRQIARRQFFYGAKVEDAEYCPAVGQVVKNNKHRRQIAKQRGWEEVGNTDMNAWADKKQRELEQERQREYNKIADMSIVLGKSS